MTILCVGKRFVYLILKKKAMVILEMTNQFAERIYEGSFFLSIALSALFYVKYRKYSMELQKEDMIDQFLK